MSNLSSFDEMFMELEEALMDPKVDRHPINYMLAYVTSPRSVWNQPEMERHGKGSKTLFPPRVAHNLISAVKCTLPFCLTS
jgi:hypothetical protein